MALQCEKIKQINIIKNVVLDGINYVVGDVIEMIVSVYTHKFYEDVYQDFEGLKSCSLVFADNEIIPNDTEYHYS